MIITLRTATTADLTAAEASHAERDADVTEQDGAAPEQTTTVTARADGSIDLVGSREIQDLLGLCRSRIYQITTQSDFPAPVAHLAQGKVWLTEDVSAWIAEHRHRT